MISTTVGFERHQFWSSKKGKGWDTPFKFNAFMSRECFDYILSGIKYTKRESTTYCNRFWEIQELQEEWNMNMAEQFMPSWIVCLDESMSKWINKYTCPGFMVVPRKPWPFGNEYHTICCSETGILFCAELVEGKDRPKDAPPREYDNLGKTVGLCLHLTKFFHGTGNVLIMDSGFCVVQALVELKKRGVFSSALIKKRRYWPKHIKGEAMKEHFKDKEPGYFDAKRAELDGVPFYVYGMKEPDYILLFMTTFGSTARMGKIQARQWKDPTNVTRTVKFKYPEVCNLHYEKRGSVDENNARRMDPIAVEEQCKTHRLEKRVFQFFW